MIVLYRHQGGVAIVCPQCRNKATVKKDSRLTPHKAKDGKWCSGSLCLLTPNPYTDREAASVTIVSMMPGLPNYGKLGNCQKKKRKSIGIPKRDATPAAEGKEARRNLLEENKTEKGGYTRKFLKSIGVSWPPEKGWKEHYIKTGQGTNSQSKRNQWQKRSDEYQLAKSLGYIEPKTQIEREFGSIPWVE